MGNQQCVGAKRRLCSKYNTEEIVVLLSTEVSLFIVEKRIRIIMDTTTITATAIMKHSLYKNSPEKIFHFVTNENCNCSECPYMKLNTLEKVRDGLLHLAPRLELSAELIERARLPLERMLAIK